MFEPEGGGVGRTRHSTRIEQSHPHPCAVRRARVIMNPEVAWLGGPPGGQ